MKRGPDSTKCYLLRLGPNFPPAMRNTSLALAIFLVSLCLSCRGSKREPIVVPRKVESIKVERIWPNGSGEIQYAEIFSALNTPPLQFSYSTETNGLNVECVYVGTTRLQRSDKANKDHVLVFYLNGNYAETNYSMIRAEVFSGKPKEFVLLDGSKISLSTGPSFVISVEDRKFRSEKHHEEQE